jgi:hypothetical protein
LSSATPLVNFDEPFGFSVVEAIALDGAILPRPVEVRQDAQRRWYRVRPEPLVEIDVWLKPYGSPWVPPRPAGAGLARHRIASDPRPQLEGNDGRGDLSVGSLSRATTG